MAQVRSAADLEAAAIRAAGHAEAAGALLLVVVVVLLLLRAFWWHEDAGFGGGPRVAMRGSPLEGAQGDEDETVEDAECDGAASSVARWTEGRAREELEKTHKLATEFDDWFQNLFKDDARLGETEGAAKGSQGAKARRLSLGGTSSSLLLNGKLANGKVVRRQQSLPDIRKGFIVGDRREILESDKEREEREQAQAELERRESLKFRRIEWKSDRKLSVAPDPERALAAAAGSTEYDAALHFDLGPTGLGQPGDLAKLAPGVSFFPLIAQAAKAAPRLRACLSSCLAVGFAPGTGGASSTDGFVHRDAAGGSNQQVLTRGYSMSTVLDAADELFLGAEFVGFPVAVAKRTHFKLEATRPSSSPRCENVVQIGPHSSLVFLYTKEHILQEFSRSLSGPLMLQKYIKSKGARPWAVRVQYCSKLATCKRVWVLTSTSEFVLQPDKESATRVGQIWGRTSSEQRRQALDTAAKDVAAIHVPVAREESSSVSAERRLGSLHPLRGTSAQSIYTHQLATDTSSRGRCSIVPAKAAVWPEPVKLGEELGHAICKSTRFPFEELVFDFVQDEAEMWWLLQVKSYKLNSQAAVVEALQAEESDNVQPVRVLRPCPAEAQQPRSRISVESPAPKAFACAGDFCAELDATAGGDGAQGGGLDKQQHQVLKRQVFLERAAARAEEAGHQGAEQLKVLHTEVDLERWFTAAEAKQQLEPTRVCESCYLFYARAAERRKRLHEKRAMRSRAGDAKADVACKRLYERFAGDERAKNMQMASMMVEQEEERKRHEQEAAAARAKNQQSNAEKRLKRRRRKQSRRCTEPLPGETGGGDRGDGGGEWRQRPSSGRSVGQQAEREATRVVQVVSEQQKRFAADLQVGDRVMDALLGAGTVLEATVGTELVAVRFDSGVVQGELRRTALRPADGRAASAVRLSADELVGFGPLAPPIMGPAPPRPDLEGVDEFEDDEWSSRAWAQGNNEPGGPATTLDGDGSARGGWDTSRSSRRSSRGGPRVSAVSKSFASMFVSNSEESDSREEAGMLGVKRQAQKRIDDAGKAGVLCPFGCGARLHGSVPGSLKGTHAAWAAHMQDCPRKHRIKSAMPQSIPMAEKPVRRGLGIAKVQSTVSELDF